MSKAISQYFRGANSGLVAKAVNLAGGFINVFLMTRIIGPGGYGTYVLANTFMQFTSLVSRVGLDKCVLYRVPRLKAKGDKDERKYFASTFIHTTLIAVTGLIIFWFVSPEIAKLFGNQSLVFWLRHLVILLPFLNLKKIFSQWLIANERVPEQKLFAFIIPRSISTIALLIVFFFFSNSPIYVFFGLALAKIAPVLFWSLKEKVYIHFSFDILPREDWWYGIRMMGNSILDRFLWRIDIFFVSYFLGDVATGGYNIIVKFAKLGKLMDTLTTSVFRPKIGKFLEMDKIQALKREYDELRSLSLVFCLVYGLGLAIFGSFIFRLFGPYGQYVDPALVLLAGYSVVISYGNIGNILVMEGEASWLLLASTLGLLVNLVGNYFLIPLIGLGGAAIATSSSLIVLNTTAYLIVRNYLELDMSSWLEQTMALGAFSIFLGSLLFFHSTVNWFSFPVFIFLVSVVVVISRGVIFRNMERLKRAVIDEYNRLSG